LIWIYGLFSRPPAIQAVELRADAARALASESGTACVATFNVSTGIPSDLAERAASPNTWLVEDRVFAGSPEQLAAASRARLFGATDSIVVLSYQLDGSLFQREYNLLDGAWILARTGRAVPC
jgi:hypothetical protein